MRLDNYGTLLRLPRVAPVMLASQVGRLPLGMMGFALILFVHERTGSFACAGATTAAAGLSAGVTAPYLGRLADRFRWTRVVIPCAFMECVAFSCLIVLALTDASRVLLPVAAAVAGAARPPLAACTRALWPRLVHNKVLLDAAYGIEGSMVEVTFVVGPLLTAGLATIDPAVAVAAAALLSVAGSVLFAVLSGFFGQAVRGPARPSWGALSSPGFRVVFAASLAVGLLFGTLEVAVPAFAAERGLAATAGIAFAAMAAASLFSGLCYGARTWQMPVAKRYVTFLVLFACGLVPLYFATSITEIVLLMGLAGAALAPMYASSYALIDEVAPQGAVTEAYAWASTANVGGTAVGAAITGPLVEQVSVRSGFVLTAALAVVAAAIAYARRHHLSPAGRSS